MGTPTATTLRTTIAGLLESAGIVAAGRVFDTRTTPIPDGQLPAIAVYVVSSAVDDGLRSRTSQSYRVTHTVAIQGILGAKTDADLGADLDTMEAAILSAVLSDVSWFADYEDVHWTGTEKGKTSEGDERRGSATVTIDVRSHETIAQSGLGSFTTAHLDTALGDNDPDKTPQTGWEADVT
jgi:hypothetical protein